MNRTPIKRVSSRLQGQKRAYSILRAEYLSAHPLCQAVLLEKGIPELRAFATAQPINGGAIVNWKGTRFFIPKSSEIHHRNKRHGKRLTDVRWFLAVSPVMHRWIENNLVAARALGWSLDISANPDGMTPGGQQALTTDELFAQISE